MCVHVCMLTNLLIKPPASQMVQFPKTSVSLALACDSSGELSHPLACLLLPPWRAHPASCSFCLMLRMEEWGWGVKTKGSVCMPVGDFREVRIRGEVECAAARPTSGPKFFHSEPLEIGLAQQPKVVGRPGDIWKRSLGYSSHSCLSTSFSRFHTDLATMTRDS